MRCMLRQLHRVPLILSALVALAGPIGAQANLGLGKMWLFEDPPLEYLKETHDFAPGADWFDLVRLASLRFGAGCSASFVSAKGLILTNHHCVRGDIARNQGDRDWVADGFVASGLEDEVRLDGLTVQQLMATEDVTEAMAEGVAGDASAEEAERQRAENRAAVLAAAAAARPEWSHEVVTLFQGARFHLYSYKVYTDVRLVCAPHLQTAHFGGDPDNFTYPRFSIDFALCRAYEDGAPADTTGAHFRWSEVGAQRGEVVFVTGNPGTTQRQLTAAQMRFLADVRYPIVRELIDGQLQVLRTHAAAGSDAQAQLRTQILRFENSQKAYRGMHETLLDAEFVAAKAGAEREFRRRIEADPALRARYGDLWSSLEQVARERAAAEAAIRFHTPGGSRHLAKGLALLRAAHSDDQAALRTAARMPVEMSPVATAAFADHLRRAARWLPASDPFLRSVLGGNQPEEAAAHLATASRLGELEWVEKMAESGSRVVFNSADPALVVAGALLPLADAGAAREAELSAREKALGARLGQALFAAYGTAVSPDATFTLRFSDGVVAGYDYNGTVAPHRTVFYGLYARNAEFDDTHPFDLPPVWLQRRDRVDLAKSVNFVCTNDTTGGNSGSPVINADRQLVGLLFDGNIESLGNEFLFRDRVQRSVCVHTEAIEQALAVIYDASRVLEELREGGF